jgi:hypothetical protein
MVTTTTLTGIRCAARADGEKSPNRSRDGIGETVNIRDLILCGTFMRFFFVSSHDYSMKIV